MTAGIDAGSSARDRASVMRAARELVLGVVRRRTPGGASIVVEGAPGIGKTFLARDILSSVGPATRRSCR